MILDRAHVLLRDDRSDLRIGDKGPLSWGLKYKQKEGRARILNISASGMQIEADTVFDPNEECILSFDSPLGKDSYIPQVGRLVWQKKRRFTRNRNICGIKFVEADEDVLDRMRWRVREGVSRFLKKRRITTVIGLSLCLAFAGLMGYVVWMSSSIYQDVTNANQKIFTAANTQAATVQNYRGLYQANEAELTDKTKKLDIATQLIKENKAAIALFSKELEATRALLNQTEILLTQSGGRNSVLDSEIKMLQSRIQAQTLKRDNATSMAAIELSMEEYRLKLKSIKNDMRRLKNKQRAADVAAMASIENERLRLGNNGYFVKNGQAVEVDTDKYRRVGASDSSNAIAVQGNRNVEIDVTFFE